MTVKFDEYDELDRKLVHALHLDGRVPMSRLAEALGVSDKTLARRYTRLRAAGAVRVIGAVDPFAIGYAVWILRIRCAPNTSERIAQALARRSDTKWILFVSGGTELLCKVQSPSSADGESLLLRKLSGTPRIEGIYAHAVLHRFSDNAGSPFAKLGPLEPDQVAALDLTAAAPVEPIVLDSADLALLTALEAEGRAGFEQLAAATGLSQSAVQRRLRVLRERGALYFEVEFDWRLLGLGTRAQLWLECAPDRIHEVGTALASHPETGAVFATTGPTNLLAAVLCRDHRALYRYLAESVGRVEGILRMESTPVVRTAKQIINHP